METITLITSSLLVEILLALTGIENAPQTLESPEYNRQVILKVCGELEAPKSLECALDVLVAVSSESTEKEGN